MKTKSAALVIIFFSMVMFACRKENKINGKDLYGKWILIEVYDPYRYGGASSWHTISGTDSHSLEFYAMGQFRKIENAGGTFQQCTGSYRLISENKIEVNSNCLPAIEKWIVTELKDNVLIIDILGTEGVLRYKYKNG